jgi:hypothetical protein
MKIKRQDLFQGSSWSLDPSALSAEHPATVQNTVLKFFFSSFEYCFAFGSLRFGDLRVQNGCDSGFEYEIHVWRQLLVLFLLSRQFPQLAKEKAPIARKKDQSWLAARFSGSFKARAFNILLFQVFG